MRRIKPSPHPFEHYLIELRGAPREELMEIAEALGLGLTPEEMEAIRDYYTAFNRPATDVELQTYDQTWSEHCYHKTFKAVSYTHLTLPTKRIV